MKFLLMTIFLLSSLPVHADAVDVGNSFNDPVNSIFNDDCKIISDQAVKDAVITISEQYQSIVHRSNSKCSPEAVAPDLNNLMRGPVCDFLGSQRTNYDFCKPRPTDPLNQTVVMDINPLVEDIPWAKTIGALVSYTEIMVRNKCFEKMVGNGQNWGQVASNFLGVIQMVSMSTAPIEPTMASVAIGSRLGMILFSAIGAIQQALEERARSVDPLTFSTKMCGLRKYLLNRQRATCLANCSNALESANQELKDQMCSNCDTTIAFLEFQDLTTKYEQYSSLLTNISDFDLQASNQLLTPEQEILTESFVSTINQDRNILAEKLGYENQADFIDKYFDVTNQNDPRLKWLDYSKPTTTIGTQKDEINLLMGVPGLILKDHLCDDPERKLITDPFFKDYMSFTEEQANSFCNKMAIYHQCGKSDGWKDPEQKECYEERQRLLTHGYSPLNESPFKTFMSALQIQKLTQEVKSNNSACFSVNHCEQNKYNCMAIMATYDGSNSCGALAGLTADSRQLKYLQTVKDFDYIRFHRQYLQQEIDKVEETSEYQRYLNLRFAQDELQSLLDTISTKSTYEECMTGRREHERKKECLAEYNAMKSVAMKTINKCVFNSADGYTGDSGTTYAETSWKNFFKTSFSGGNLQATVKRVLKAKKNPWIDYKADPEAKPITQKKMDSLAENLCRTLYCPLNALDNQVVNFNLFDIYTWFGGENPPLIRHSSDIRRHIRRWCEPRLGSAADAEEFMKCDEMKCQTIVTGVLENFHGPDNEPLDLAQCLPAEE